METRISVVVPAFNEAPNLPALVQEVEDAVSSLGDPWELVVVDDGSTDDSPALLRDLQARHPSLRVVRFARNAGQSAAFLAGFEAARGEVVVTLDADLQNNPADIPELVRRLEGHEAVLGVRRRRRDAALRRVSSRIANAVRRGVTGDGLSDVGCSLKAFRREALRDLPRFNGVHRFFGTLLVWRGCRIVEVPVDHRPRRAGEAKYNVRNRAFRTLLDLLAMRWLRSRWVRYEIEK
jgi:glycosyltransferase involved in cell wall biosynthesis